MPLRRGAIIFPYFSPRRACSNIRGRSSSRFWMPARVCLSLSCIGFEIGLAIFYVGYGDLEAPCVVSPGVSFDSPSLSGLLQD